MWQPSWTVKNGGLLKWCLEASDCTENHAEEFAVQDSREREKLRSEKDMHPKTTPARFHLYHVKNKSYKEKTKTRKLVIHEERMSVNFFSSQCNQNSGCGGQPASYLASLRAQPPHLPPPTSLPHFSPLPETNN